MSDFSLIIDELPAVVFIADCETFETKYINSYIYNLTGFTAKEWMADPRLWEKQVHPDDLPRVKQQLSSLKQQETVTTEYRLADKDNNYRWIRDFNQIKKNDEGKGEYIFGMLTDLTPEKELLSQAQQHLDELIRESATVVYRCAPDGDFPATFISENIERQTGYTPADFLEDSTFWASHIHPDDRERLFADLGKLFEEGKHSHEYRFLHKDGHYVWMHDELRLVYDDKGNVKDIVGNWVDISETKKLEDEAKQHQKALQQAQKMQAVGTLAGGVAHEFNNMLGVIFGYGELLSEVLPEGNKGRDYLEQMLEAGNKSKRLVQQLLSFAHRKTRSLKPYDLCEATRAKLDAIRGTLPAGIELQLSACQSGFKTLLDLDEYHQIVANLVQNAVQSIDKGGSIELKIDVHELANASFVPQDGRYLCLSVRDNGKGMSDETRAKIFEPFFTTRSAGEGTGMGLALVYGAIKGYGGGIDVESTPGQGSCFRLYFPIASVEEETADNQKTTPLKPAKPGKVLFVDDEKLYHGLAKILLKKLDLDVVESTSSKEALSLFLEDPQSYDLVITDQVMPEMQGTELAREIMAVRPECKVVMCTGYSQIENQEEIQKSGIRDVIYKPYSKEHFLQVVKLALAS